MEKLFMSRLKKTAMSLGRQSMLPRSLLSWIPTIACCCEMLGHCSTAEMQQ